MFSYFAQLWILAFFLHHSEDWDRVGVTVLALLLVLWVNRARDRARPFLVSVAFFTVYNFAKAPYLANHANYYLLLCAFLMLWASLSWLRSRKLSEARLGQEFLGLRPALCLSLVVVYFMAGFHKLNFDFFDPQVSCASDFFLRYSREYGFSASLIPRFLLDWSPYLVVVVELVGALLLLVPRTQLLGVLSFVGLHSYLSPLSFYDFASICYSILLCFMPPVLYEGVENRARVQKGVNVLLGCTIGGSVVARLMMDNRLDGLIEADVAQGWFFLAGTFYLMNQIRRNAAAEGFRPWNLPGLDFLDFAAIRPRWALAMPALLLLFTNTSYLGLRTGGNTSMFSNLRTEGGASNHLVMSSSWQVFDFQKDLVYVEEIPRRHEKFKRGQPREGMAMTSFELRRLAEMWRERGDSVPMTIEYDGESHSYDDITEIEPWSQPLPWLAKKLMLFRVIQPEGPNECRW